MATYTVMYGTCQSDCTVAEATVVAQGVTTLSECRRIIRREIGVARLRQGRLWRHPAPDVIEAWCATLDPEEDAGYFIHQD